VSPIMVRPVREQLEHDRLIRFLLTKYNKKQQALANIGEEHATAVKIGQLTLFPDVVLTDGKKIGGLVEVETGESVNNLEALAQWVHFSHARVPFHLYVPVQSYDSARRLCELNHVAVAELWTYRGALEGFDLVRMYHNASAANAAGKMAILAPPPKPKVPEPEKPVVVAPVIVPAKATKPAAKPVPGAKPALPAPPPPPPPAAKKPATAIVAKPVAKPPGKPPAGPAAKPSKPARATAVRQKPAKPVKAARQPENKENKKKPAEKKNKKTSNKKKR